MRTTAVTRIFLNMPPQIDTINSTEKDESIQQSVSDDQDERRINVQKYLLTLLFIQWFVFAITLAFGIYAVFSENVTNIFNESQSLLPILVLFLYYSFGLFVAYKQYRVGLLIFASIGVLLFIAISIFIGYILLIIIALGNGFGTTSQTFEFIVFLGILFMAVAVVAIMSLKFSFDLAKLIERSEYSTV